MIGALARKIFGSSNERIVRGLQPLVHKINALEPKLEALSDSELRALTAGYRERVAGGESLDALLPEAFATVREAAKRTLGQRHFDVQMTGGIVLHQGKIAEMKTGEGKTLVATLAVYLNALAGKGVHVVTVNDYLAKRDSEWMGQIYRFLGMSVGCIVHGLSDPERRAAYACDITYGTNNEFGFDYLRDNMKFRLEEMVHRPFNYAIVDEVDSILIDEARTPLIISGPAQDSSEMYVKVDAVIPLLTEEEFELDEKTRTVNMSEVGQERMELLLTEAGVIVGGGLYDIHNVNAVHHVQQALRAHKLFKRDRDYVVKDQKVVIVDEFTGRMMEGRRYSEGLHQALEAKERVPIQRENQTLASITFQNYFRLYPKLAGMTGTALTEASEFGEIYRLEVIEIPTNLDVNRTDEDDEVYRSAAEKNKAIIALIKEAHERGQPLLVGTVSIEKSEKLAALLKQEKVPHHVLNARFHEQEAFIISQAGRSGGVTIATNMAGRGTDIQLGGNPDMRIKLELTEVADDVERMRRAQAIRDEVAVDKKKVLAAGGLYVIGTERHESRRIDNQLRGRSGRQGDPGHSKFFLSLEDDLMRIFATDRLDGMLRRLGLKEDEAIVHPWINKALEKAQQKVEARNFDIRKNLLKFDNVMNDQRKVIYEQRRDVMNQPDIAQMIVDMRHDVVSDMVGRAIPENSYAEKWNADGLKDDLQRLLGLDLPVHDWVKEEGIAEAEIESRIVTAIDAKMDEKTARFGPEMMRTAEKSLLLQILDQSWKDHLLTLDHLRQGISLRAYAQRDPLREYQTEAFELFKTMLSALRETMTRVLAHAELRVQQPDQPPLPPPRPKPSELRETRVDPAFAGGNGAPTGTMAAAASVATIRRSPPPGIQVDPKDPETWGKVARNEPCPCGSGKKFKHCHGVMA